jgi:hypothetical protein
MVDGRCGLNLSDLGYGKVAACFEHGHKYSASIRYCEILDYMRKCQLLTMSDKFFYAMA